MHIGILTLFHGNNNWGGNLQGYALKKYIEENFNNVCVDLINYQSNANVIYKNKIEQTAQYGISEIINKISERIIEKKYPVEEKLHNRTKLFEEFQHSYSTNDYIYNDENLQSLSNKYDCLICGSDQIWNPNVARPGYFLKDIDKAKKVSYAASIARDSLSEKEASAMMPLIRQFDCISVREKTAKTILNSYFKGKKQIYEVLDPVLMLNKKQWSDFIGTEKYIKESYALMFFFSDSKEYRDYIEKCCNSHNLKLVGIPHATKYIKNDESGNYEKIYDVGPIEFLKLFRDASYIFTDSFHGSVFSIIFEHQFCVFERDKHTHTSKNSRLYDLLDKFNLSNRMVKNIADFNEISNIQINYNNVNDILEKEKEYSKSFLSNALKNCNENNKQEKTVADISKEMCYGCGLCAQVCPKKCIELSFDNEGFLYPTVDSSKCIECGRCIQECINNKEVKSTNIKDAYVGYNLSEDVRKESSSGGIFNAIASLFIEKGGVVYGAAFDNEFAVKHIRIDNKKDLLLIMKSKYVQSNLENVFELIMNDLKNGKQVMFSGTPCQTASVCKFADSIGLKEKLYTVDFICHGVPSPMMWKSYLNYISKGNIIHEVNFRDKSPAGWHDYHLHIKYGNNGKLNESHEMNAYMNLFLSDKNIRPSCCFCNFKADNYVSDLTLADAWKIEKEYEKWADDKGTSLFIIRSDKGKELIESSDNIEIKNSNYQLWSKMNPSLVTRTMPGNGRKEMFSDFLSLDKNDFWKKYGSISIKKKIRYSAKKFAKIIGAEKMLRKKI